MQYGAGRMQNILRIVKGSQNEPCGKLSAKEWVEETIKKGSIDYWSRFYLKAEEKQTTVH